MSLPRFALTLTAAAVLVVSAACGSATSTTDSAGAAAESPSAAGRASRPADGSPSPSGPATLVPDSLRFTSTTVEGAPFDAATLAGKPAVLWFWAAWCPRCRAAASQVAAVQADYADRVNVVGVAGLGSGTDKMRDFIADTGISALPNLADDAGTVWKKFGVTAQEYFVIIDSSGTVIHKGPLSRDDLRARVDQVAG